MKLGMVVPDPGDIAYLNAGSRDAANAARRLQAGIAHCDRAGAFGQRRAGQPGASRPATHDRPALSPGADSSPDDSPPATTPATTDPATTRPGTSQRPRGPPPAAGGGGSPSP